MLKKLALLNIRQKKFRTFLASLSIAIGTASLVVFLGLSQGIQNATFDQLEKSNPLTQITVKPDTEKTGVINFLAGGSEDINDQTIEEIKKIKGVKEIYPELQYSNFSSLEIEVFGQGLVTDSMVFGVPGEFIADDLENSEVWGNTENTNLKETSDSKTNWGSEENPYPTLIPRKFLDLYNVAVAGPQGLPLFDEESLKGKEIILYPTHSSFFPSSGSRKNKIYLNVVGFSDKINLIGVTIPFEAVLELEENYGKLQTLESSETRNSEKETEETKSSELEESSENLSEEPTESLTYLELFVETENPEITEDLAQEIEELGFSTEYFQKNLANTEAKFKYLEISLSLISLIILITATIAIISTFLSTIAERQKEIGLFRALGATKNQIQKLILAEAAIVGTIGSVIGITLGIITSQILNKLIAQNFQSNSLSLSQLFEFEPKLIIGTLIFGVLISIAAAYFPARKASNLKPIECLRR